jgi:hypothetical protein
VKIFPEPTFLEKMAYRLATSAAGGVTPPDFCEHVKGCGTDFIVQKTFAIRDSDLKKIVDGRFFF